MKRSMLAILSISLFTSSAAFAQTATVHTTGLNTPNKVIKAPDNSLIVAEAGTTTANTGRLSIVDRTTGARHTLISGLPSAVSFLGGPAGDPDGPSGLDLRGNRLLVVIGVGDAVLPGAGPGLETPNPTPSSPIFNSILELTLTGGFTSLDSPFVMTLAHQAALDAGNEVTLVNAEGVELTVRLVADLPDWRPNPTPTVPTNVRASHLYGIAVFQKVAFVADAGHNEIKRVELSSGEVTVLVAFPPRPNPLPFGPPFVEAVPSNVHRFGNRLLVPLLTGFPFAPNIAEVRRVEIKTATHDQLIGGLTSAIDIAKAGDDKDAAAEADGALEFERSGPVKGGVFLTSESRLGIARGGVLDPTESYLFSDAPARGTGDSSIDPGDGNSYYTLEFSTNLLAGAPGRLRFYQNPDAAPVNVLTNLITPTSMVFDGETGNLFITNIGPGTLTKVVFP